MNEIETFEKHQERKRIEKIESEILTLHERLAEVTSILKDTITTLIEQNTGYLEIIEKSRIKKESRE